MDLNSISMDQGISTPYISAKHWSFGGVKDRKRANGQKSLFLDEGIFMERHCLYCNEPIQGRSDKKFCDDQCRSSYNYNKNAGHSPLVRKIIGILKKNRKIIKELNHGTSGTTKVSREELLAKGFDFDYYTSIYQTRAGDAYFFCFEMGYLKLDNDKILLVVKDNHPLKERDG
ncbi:DUF2116 family Zn-ribbon domain-containing protein [Flagellimonas alvinocaridis]|nr:DUF2116 family Zn-ribbon domain-containing protein [Allomuricauda alvinocaridis]